MKPEAMRIAIAEVCCRKLFVLHKRIHDPFGYYRENAHGYTGNLAEAWKVTEEVAAKYVSGRPSDPDLVIAEPAPLPDYPNDLNAMHEAEATLGESKHRDYCVWLTDITRGGTYFPTHYDDLFVIAHATASQRAEAFLRTLGLWKEEE